MEWATDIVRLWSCFFIKICLYWSKRELLIIH